MEGEARLTVTPDFIGIGVQKCATGWVARVLDAHPEIGVATSEDGKKNLYFFDHHWDRGFGWYEKHFQDTEAPVRGEYSTSYVYSADARSRIHRHAPRARLLVSLRNPVDRAYAQHKHQLARGRLQGADRDFDTALERNPTYLMQSRYHEHLSHWIELFGRDRLHVILVERIRDEPEAVAGALYGFLGVDPDVRPEGLGRRVHASRREGVLEKVKAGIRGRPASFPPLDDATRARLHDYFQEENARLSRLLDLDLSCWDR